MTDNTPIEKDGKGPYWSHEIPIYPFVLLLIFFVGVVAISFYAEDIRRNHHKKDHLRCGCMRWNCG